LYNLGKPIRVQNFPPNLNAKYTKLTKEITKLIKEENQVNSPSSKLSDTEKLTKIADIAVKKENLLATRKQIRGDAEMQISGVKSSPDNLERLEKLEHRRTALDIENTNLRSNLNSLNDKLKGKMAVLSIPYDVHRKFPSTGAAGLNDEIRSLKGADEVKAKSVMEKYRGEWEDTVTKAINNG